MLIALSSVDSAIAAVWKSLLAVAAAVIYNIIAPAAGETQLVCFMLCSFFRRQPVIAAKTGGAFYILVLPIMFGNNVAQ